MKKKGFTLIELIVVVVIIGILAVLGIPAYQSIVTDSYAKVCAKNNEALAIAANILIMENDGISASMSQLPAEYIKRGYAQVLKQKDSWKLKLAYFIIGLEKGNLAYAGELLNRLSGGKNNLLVCPAQEPGKNSYGINKIMLGKTAAQIKALPPDTILIADCDTEWFSGDDLDAELKHRHKKIEFLNTKEYAIGANNSGQIGKKSPNEEFEVIYGIPGLETPHGHCMSECKQGHIEACRPPTNECCKRHCDKSPPADVKTPANFQYQQRKGKDKD